MKKHKISHLAIIATLAAALFSCSESPTKQVTEQAKTTMTLKEALAQKLISVTTKSTGNYSGGSVSIAFKSNSRKDLKIIVPAGSLFDTDNDDEQDMIVVDEQRILVKAKSNPTKTINGYCCQHSNKAPSKGSVFKPSTTKNDKLIQLAHYISKNKGIPEGVKQSAVWAVSDNSSIANVYDYENPEKVKLNNVCFWVHMCFRQMREDLSIYR